MKCPTQKIISGQGRKYRAQSAAYLFIGRDISSRNGVYSSVPRYAALNTKRPILTTIVFQDEIITVGKGIKSGTHAFTSGFVGGKVRPRDVSNVILYPQSSGRIKATSTSATSKIGLNFVINVMTHTIRSIGEKRQYCLTYNI